MGHPRKLRLVGSVVLVACLVFALAVPALAEEGEESAEPSLISEQADTSFEGVYDVGGSTNTGKGFDAVVKVKSLGEMIQFSARTMGVSVTTAGEATWSGADQVTVPVAANIRIASGSGTVTLTRAGSGAWEMSGSGSGSVLSLTGFKDGSVTFAGSQRGTPAPATEVAEVTGVPEPVRALSDAVDPIAPSDTQGELETQRRANAAVALIFVAFLLAILEVIFGIPFL